MKLRMIFLLLFLPALNSCATFQSYLVCDIHNETGASILHPVAFNANLISNQHVTISTAEDRFEFLSQLEVNRNRLVLVALTPIGHKLFQIEYRRQQLVFERFGIPENFNPAYLLSDISLIYGSAPTLRECRRQSGLAPLQIREAGNQRLVLYPEQEQVSIDYSTTDKWSSDIVFNNPMRGYKIEIKSLGLEQL